MTVERVSLTAEVDDCAAQARRRAPGSLESDVMAVLWARAEPATAADVQEAVSGELAYNTVQTILIRLHETVRGAGYCVAADGGLSGDS